MFNKFFFLLSGLTLFHFTNIQAQYQLPQVKSDLYYLASPELAGRFPGTRQDSMSVFFLRDRLENLSLSMPFESGLQPFKVVTSVEAGNNQLKINAIEAVYGQDFSLYALSSNESLESDIVFAGFGMVISTDSLKWDDYEGLNVNGKWVLLLKGDPEPQNNNSAFIPFSDTRTKVMFARDRGAKGVIFTGGIQNNKTDELVPLLFERAVVSSGLPVIDVKRSFLDKILVSMNQTIDSLEAGMMRHKKPSQSTLVLEASATTELIKKEVTTFNIIGILEGNDPTLKQEYVIVGAHYDHLGMGGEGSGSRMPDTLAPHLGADDNASGVVAVLELAARMSQNKQNRRSVAFVLFGAEEMGLLGSRYFVKNMPFEPVNVTAMLNFDMVGRLNDQNAVVVGGTGTASETEELLRTLDAASDLQLSFSPEGFGASDHASFYAENIPVMFISTGAHSDYHTPDDRPDKINFQGLMLVSDLAEKIAGDLASRDSKLSFTEAGPKERTTGRRGFKVTLGIMPDFTSTSTDGLGVGGVTKGGPAERSGMKKGDKITGINGLAVGTIYDYMNRLKTLKPGQRVNVDIVRDGKPLILIVDL